jgi:hypothetical protein
MTVFFDKSISLDNFKELVIELIKVNMVYDKEWFCNNLDDNQQDNILGYMIKTNNTNIAEYLINLGMPYDDDLILLSEDIDFIKKYVDINKYTSNYLYMFSYIIYFLNNPLLLPAFVRQLYSLLLIWIIHYCYYNNISSQFFPIYNNVRLCPFLVLLAYFIYTILLYIK